MRQKVALKMASKCRPPSAHHRRVVKIRAVFSTSLPPYSIPYRVQPADHAQPGRQRATAQQGSVQPAGRNSQINGYLGSPASFTCLVKPVHFIANENYIPEAKIEVGVIAFPSYQRRVAIRRADGRTVGWRHKMQPAGAIKASSSLYHQRHF